MLALGFGIPSPQSEQIAFFLSMLLVSSILLGQSKQDKTPKIPRVRQCVQQVRPLLSIKKARPLEQVRWMISGRYRYRHLLSVCVVGAGVAGRKAR